MKEFLLLLVALFLSGCAATTQIAQVQQPQQHKELVNCRLLINYNCAEPIVGQAYSCSPTVSEQCDPK